MMHLLVCFSTNYYCNILMFDPLLPGIWPSIYQCKPQNKPSPTIQSNIPSIFVSVLIYDILYIFQFLSFLVDSGAIIRQVLSMTFKSRWSMCACMYCGPHSL